MIGGKSARVLIYSHDSFGLGHLRRCRTIAHHLVAKHKNLSVLILSGSPIIGSFDFRARVDFVRVPGVVKLRNGEYTPLSLHLDIKETLGLRGSIIEHTAGVFDPDVFIVDKEPSGLRGEVHAALATLKSRGTRLILGLRDVMDDPALLAPEWRGKNVLPLVRDLYDEIWVYGLPQIWDPLRCLDLPESVRRKTVFTGYLPREVGAGPAAPGPDAARRPFVLVTPGGGGDGDSLVDWVLRAYESDPLLPYAALIVLGPFMAPETRAGFAARAQRLERVEAITFEPRLERLMDEAEGVVSMGGYNTFCEILSLNKRALVVPRQRPRLEQKIRATRAEALGLVRVLLDDGERRPEAMAAALRAMPRQRRPLDVAHTLRARTRNAHTLRAGTRAVPGLLEGLENVNRLIAPWLQRERPARGRAAASA